MTQFLRKMLSSNGRGATFAPRAASWRSVPRVNVLPTGQGAAANLILPALVVVFLIEILVLGGLYRGLSTPRDRADVARPELVRLRVQLKAADASVVALNDELAQLEGGQDTSQAALAELKAGRRDWATSLTALFGAEVPGITFDSVVSNPGGRIEVIGAASDESAVGRFQSHIRTLSRILEMQSIRLTRGDASLNFTAAFLLK